MEKNYLKVFDGILMGMAATLLTACGGDPPNDLDGYEICCNCYQTFGDMEWHEDIFLYEDCSCDVPQSSLCPSAERKECSNTNFKCHAVPPDEEDPVTSSEPLTAAKTELDVTRSTMHYSAEGESGDTSTIGKVIFTTGAWAGGVCPITITMLRLQPNDTSVGGLPLTGAAVVSASNMDGTLAADGNFTIPKDNATMWFSGWVDGDRASGQYTAKSDIGGYIGTNDSFWMAGSFSGPDSSSYSFNLEGTIVVRPPTADAGPDLNGVCNPETGVGTVAASGTAADPYGEELTLYWYLNTYENGEFLDGGEDMSVELPPGSHTLSLYAYNAIRGKAGFDQTIATIYDTAPAIITVVGVDQLVSCDPDATELSIPMPEVTDLCSDTAPVLTGEITLAAGQPTSIPVVNGKAVIPPGTTTVVWTVTKSNGVVSTASQTFEVVARSVLTANGNLDVRDGAVLMIEDNGPALIYNHGSTNSEIGAGAAVGEIRSVADVLVRSQGTVDGDVTTAGTITMQADASILGDSFQWTTPILPPYPVVAAVYPSSYPVEVPNDHPGYDLDPGSYGNVIIRSRGQVNLVGGTYRIQSLNIEPDAKVALDKSNGPVNIYVRDLLTIYDRATFIDPSDSIEGLNIYFTGTATVNVEAGLSGQIVAPFAPLVLGGNGGQTYRGEFTGKDIRVEPNTIMLHRPFNCQGGTSGCDNGIQDGDETDVDCGGSCYGCENGKSCEIYSDCISTNCQNGICVPDTGDCFDNEKNNDETDVDCGGSCDKCDNGKTCSIDADCISDNCDGGVCVPISNPCSELLATDLGAPGNRVTVRNDSCLRVRDAYPVWWETRTMQLQNTDNGTYPVPFTWSNSCAGGSGTGLFDGDWQSRFLSPTNSDCATVIKLNGDGSGNLSLIYYGM